MKRYMKKIAVALLAVMLFSALASYAYAANTSYENFSIYSHAGSYYPVGAAREKTDSSAMVIYIDSSSVGTSQNVRAIGCASTGINAVNCTLYNNIPVDYVVCTEGVYYGIKNTAYEEGEGYGRLTVMHGISYGLVSGKWAPDSGQSFATPSAP